VPPTPLKVINGAVLFWQIVVDPAILANGKGLTVIVAVAEAALLQVNPLDSCTLTKEYINVPGVLVVTVIVMLLPEDVTIDWSEPLFIL
jgi:hypothetical protein